MSLNKSELKQLVLHDVGAKLDDLLEDATKNKTYCEGGKLALREAAKNIQALQAVADKELDEETIPDLATLTLVKKFITRAVTSAANLSRHYESREMAAMGSMKFGEHAVGMVSKLHTLEKSKAEAHTEPVSQSETPATGRHRPVGVRPGHSVAAQRREEENAKASRKETREVPKKGGEKGKKGAKKTAKKVVPRARNT